MSLPIDDYSSAQTGHPQQPRHLLAAIGGPDDVAGPFAFPEFTPLFQGTPGCRIYGQDVYSLVLKFLVNPSQSWSLQPAGGSTRKGEVKDHNFAFVIGKRKCRTRSGANREVGNQRSRLGRLLSRSGFTPGFLTG